MVGATADRGATQLLSHSADDEGEDEEDDESGDSEDSAEVFWDTDNDEEVNVKDSTKTVIQNITIKDSVIVGDVANAVPNTEDE